MKKAIRKRNSRVPDLLSEIKEELNSFLVNQNLSFKDIPEFKKICLLNEEDCVPDENGNVLLSENDSSTICAILGFPCPLGMQYEGKLLDTNNVLVKIKGSDKYDVILNHTHICVTNESKTTCKIR